jgi:hypothetical protein
MSRITRILVALIVALTPLTASGCTFGSCTVGSGSITC